MKKYAFLVASTVVCASMSAFATGVQGDNVFGVMAVESGTEYTLVAVPWCECSTNNDQPVAISNIVKTANLDKGDKVYVVGADGKYSAWELDKGAGDVLYWKSVAEVSLEGLGTTLDPTLATVGRGSAIILYRQNPKNGSEAKKFYLYGQVGTNTVVTTQITPNGSTLIAPPRYYSTGLNILDSNVATFTPSEGDKIVVRKLINGSSIEYTRTSDAWVYKLPPTYAEKTAGSIVIPSGAGAWYVTTSTTPKTITWHNVPSK